jgi:hypothetical protein
MQRHTRYGHPTALAIPDRRFNEQRKWIEEGLHRYSDRKAFYVALRLADERILNFSSAQPYTVLRKIEARMAMLREHGITAFDVVRRVCEFVAYIEMRPMADQRAEDFALSRAILRLAPVGRYRPTAQVLNHFGEPIREALYPFAFAFLQRLKRDIAAERATIKDSIDFDAISAQEPST